MYINEDIPHITVLCNIEICPSAYLIQRKYQLNYNGLSPVRHQAIIKTNVGILLIGPLGTNFSDILIEIHAFSFKKMHLKRSSAKCRPFFSRLQCVKRDLHPRKYRYLNLVCVSGNEVTATSLLCGTHSGSSTTEDPKAENANLSFVCQAELDVILEKHPNYAVIGLGIGWSGGLWHKVSHCVVRHSREGQQSGEYFAKQKSYHLCHNVR